MMQFISTWLSVSNCDAVESQSGLLGGQNVTQPGGQRFDPRDTRRSSPAVCSGMAPLSKVTPLKFSCIKQSLYIL